MTTAATKREVLAKAVKDWLHVPWTNESDLVLEVALIETNTITAGVVVCEITKSDTKTTGLILALESGFAIEIDQDGNTIKGAL